MPETPRIRTNVVVREVTVPTPPNFSAIMVYEASSVDAERERLLDLLEEWFEEFKTAPGSVGNRTEAALREYGRLGKEEL